MSPNTYYQLSETSRKLLEEARQRRIQDNMNANQALCHNLGSKSLSNAPVYDSKLFRARLSTACTLMTQKVPREWQLDIAESLHLGIDCIAVAGTGAGKTLPFAPSNMVEPNELTIIISPLDALEANQAKAFKEMGLRVVVINGNTWDAELQKRVDNKEFQIILTSPEMIYHDRELREILSRQKRFIMAEKHIFTP